MKRYISIICMLVSLVFCQGAFGQDTKIDFYEKQELPLLTISDALEVTLDSCRNNAVCFKHNNEYYVYLNSILVTSKLDGASTYLTWKNHKEQTAAFYKRVDGTKAEKCETLTMQDYNCIGPNGHSLASVNIRKGQGNGIFLNLRFKEYCNFSEESPLLDTVGLGFINDTLRLQKNDTVKMFKTLTVIEPQYSVYQSLTLNGEERIHTAVNDVAGNYNDPEEQDKIEIDFTSIWDKLKIGKNTITVNIATLDENCKFENVVSKSYVIEVQVDEDQKPFPWLWVILGGAALLGLVAMAVILGINCSNKKKLLQRLSACKTQICNLQDDESVPCEAKEQLESHSQRVTAAIADLRGRKLLKKADKQECGKLVDEIEEYMKNLGQQQSDPDPQPAGPAPQPEGPAPQPVDPAPQPDQGPDQKPEPQPEPEPQPQPVSNDELLAKIKELEDKLSKADEDKQAALAEQKDKLDKEHEKAVKDLTEQLEQEHKDELQKQSENHAKELKEQEAKYLKALETQRNDYERRLRDQEDEHRRQIEAIEEICARRIYAITKELNEVKGKWQEDKKYVVNMYRAYETGIGEMVESMKSNGDDVAPAYTEMLQIHSESVHSFQSFHDQFQAIMEKELTIAEMREELAKVFSVHIDYERSWINALCRLHAYSKVEKLAPMFGLYNEYKVDISELYVQFLALASILGFENIHVPELFVEEFHSSEAESDNTNLVLPNIYPNYVQALVSSTIYDIHTIGYTYDGTTRKPKVAYYV